MSRTALILPFRASNTDLWREQHLEFALRYYRSLGMDVLIANNVGKQWSKSRAVNAAVERSQASKFVISDVDCFPDVDKLRECVIKVDAWGQPFSEVIRLNANQSEVILRGTKTFDQLKKVTPVPRAAGGGLVVVTRRAYEAIGGWDERFQGWGAEDTWLAAALTAKTGDGLMLDGPLYHLHHPRDAERRKKINYKNNVGILREFQRHTRKEG